MTLTCLTSLGLVPFLLVAAACGRDDGKGGAKKAAQRSADAKSGYEPYAGPENADTAAIPVDRQVDTATLLALAACDCGGTLNDDIARTLSVAKGTLPQFLMPPVREQIRADKSLQSLLNLPFGLGGALAGALAGDAEITAKVQAGLAAKVERAAPGGSRLGSLIAFRFDGFPAFGAAGATAPLQNLSIIDSAARWQYVLAAPGIWQGAAPAALGDHGWQTLETMRLLVEWKYLFGLDSGADGSSLGGLTLPVDESAGALQPFDPRKDEAPRLLTGSYQVAFSGTSALDLALNAKESWQHVDSPVTLEEQSRLWRTAALAFKRLRPENRGASGSMFAGGAEALLPDDAHQLPLAFLPGMEALLDGRFIDQDERLIRSGVDQESADLAGLIRLIAALNAWINELDDLDDARLDDETVAKLAKAPEQLRLAVQLATQTILREHTTQSDGAGIALQLGANGDAGMTPALAAETLVTLIDAEQTVVSSPLLKDTIIGIAHWYAGEVVERGAAEGTTWTKADAAWGIAAMDRLAAYGDIDWLDDTRAILARSLSNGGAN